MWSLLWSVLVCKITQFLAKNYPFRKLITLFQKVNTLRLLKIYIMFCPPAGGKYPFFWAPARGLQPLNYIFVLSSELNSTTGWSIKRSSSPWRYFNPGSQAVLRARVQRRTMGHLSNMKMMSRNISRPIALAYPFFCIGS